MFPVSERASAEAYSPFGEDNKVSQSCDDDRAGKAFNHSRQNLVRRGLTFVSRCDKDGWNLATLGPLHFLRSVDRGFYVRAVKIHWADLYLPESATAHQSA
jgi:hypothetical protein